MQLEKVAKSNLWELGSGLKREPGHRN
jgi:hypothetical protein